MSLSKLWNYFFPATPAHTPPEPRDPIDEICDAIDTINTAWSKLDRSYRIWIDWDIREVQLQRSRRESRKHINETLYP